MEDLGRQGELPAMSAPAHRPGDEGSHAAASERFGILGHSLNIREQLRRPRHRCKRFRHAPLRGRLDSLNAPPTLHRPDEGLNHRTSASFNPWSTTGTRQVPQNSIHLAERGVVCSDGLCCILDGDALKRHDLLRENTGNTCAPSPTEADTTPKPTHPLTRTVTTIESLVLPHAISEPANVLGKRRFHHLGNDTRDPLELSDRPVPRDASRLAGLDLNPDSGVGNPRASP